MPDDLDADRVLLEFLLAAITNLHRYSLDQKPHIQAYYKAGKLHGELVNAMAQ